MITLPDPPSRALVRGTWLVLSLGAGVATAVILLVAAAPAWPLWGAGVLAILLVAGRVRSRLGRQCLWCLAAGVRRRRAPGGLRPRADRLRHRRDGGVGRRRRDAPAGARGLGLAAALHAGGGRLCERGARADTERGVGLGAIAALLGTALRSRVGVGPDPRPGAPAPYPAVRAALAGRSQLHALLR